MYRTPAARLETRRIHAQCSKKLGGRSGSVQCLWATIAHDIEQPPTRAREVRAGKPRNRVADRSETFCGVAHAAPVAGLMISQVMRS